MATYYAKVGGNDALNGLTWANAWETVHKAAITATAGDLVIFGDGTYYIAGVEDGWNSGTSGNVITFTSDTWRGATWLQSANGMKIDLEAINYVTFEELIIRGNQAYTQWTHVHIENSEYITLDDCEIYNGAGTGIVINGNGTHVSIKDCKIHVENTAGGTDGIEITSAGNQYIDIDGTEIYHCNHDGIDAIMVADLMITNCHIHDVSSHGIELRDVDTGEISNCQIHDCDTGYGTDPHSYHCGIRVVAYPDTGASAGATDITIFENDIYHNETSGIMVREDAAGPIDIYNNTLYDNNQNPGAGQLGCGSFCLITDPGTTNKNPVVRLKNNTIFVTEVDARTILVDAALETNFDADYNLFYSSSGTKEIKRNGTVYTTYTAYQTAGYETHTVIDDDPDFTDAPNDNFTLQGGSPAIDQGVDIGEPYHGSAPDIGAHEYEPQGVICMIM